MSLDELYGPCLSPDPDKPISAIEIKYEPRTLQRLTDRSARALKNYMSAAVDGLKIPQVLHEISNILWVVDKAGDVWFAIEETVDRASGRLLYPLPRSKGYSRPRNHIKLGHPSLVRHQKQARIGGEIIFDPAYGGEYDWIINNASGRFGLRSHIKKENLRAVNQKFGSFDIKLEMQFI